MAARRSCTVWPTIRTAPVADHSLLFLAAPIRDAAGRLAGVLVAVHDSGVLGRRIARPGSKVVMNDGYGNLIASRDDLPPQAERMPALPVGWDRAIPSGDFIDNDHLTAPGQVRLESAVSTGVSELVR